MIKTILLALVAMIVFDLGIVQSQEIKPNINNPVEVDKWITQKQELVERAICMKLGIYVESPQNPAHYSGDALSYQVLAETSKKFTAPLMVSTTAIPYSEGFLENVPIPNIESLSCTKTVEIWRAMYEYKTIPYKEIVRSPFDKFLDNVLYWIVKIFNYIYMAAIAVAVVIISIFMFYNTIKLTRKDSPSKLHHFALVLFPISAFAIPPFYFPWAYWSQGGSLFTYCIGCLIFIAVMIFVYLIRKYR